MPLKYASCAVTSIAARVVVARLASSSRSSFDDDRGDFVLDGEDVRQLAIEALRPELIAVVGIDELRRDAHAIARPTNAAFQGRPDPQSPADFSDVEILIPKCKRRCAGNHAQAGNARERTDDFLRDAVTEVLVIPQRAQICKRQHHDRREPCALIRKFRRRGPPPVRRLDALQGLQQLVRRTVAALGVLLEGLVDDRRKRRGQRPDSMPGVRGAADSGADRIPPPVCRLQTEISR